MTLIDGDRIVTAQLYDDEHEEFTEQKMSIIDYVNAYTNEGVTTADDVLDKIRAEVENINVWGMRYNPDTDKDRKPQIVQKVKEHVIEILDKYKAESEDKEDIKNV